MFIASFPIVRFWIAVIGLFGLGLLAYAFWDMRRSGDLVSKFDETTVSDAQQKSDVTTAVDAKTDAEK